MSGLEVAVSRSETNEDCCNGRFIVLDVLALAFIDLVVAIPESIVQRLKLLPDILTEH